MLLSYCLSCKRFCPRETKSEIIKVIFIIFIFKSTLTPSPIPSFSILSFLFFYPNTFLGEILSVMQELPFGERSAKHILFHIFKQIVNYKKQDNTKGEVRHVI